MEWELIERREIYKDAFAPQPTGKILKAWERAPVTSHAPRLHGQKIWKKRGGLRPMEDNKENYNKAFLELEKEGAGARKKARVFGNKEDISRAKWHDGKDEREALDENLMMGMGSSMKNVLGSPDRLQVVPRKRTNANLLITPRKSLRKMLLSGEGQGKDIGVPLSPAMGKEMGGSPVRRRKEARKSVRKSTMPRDDALMVDGEKHHARQTSLVFDFEIDFGEKKMESKQELEQSPKKPPKRQSLRRSVRGRVSDPTQLPVQGSATVDNDQALSNGDDSVPREFKGDDGKADAMDLDHMQDAASGNEESRCTESTLDAGSIREKNESVTLQADLLDAFKKSAKDQPHNVSTQKSTKGAKQRRSSSRRSTRQSDRLRLEATTERALNMEGVKTTMSNVPTADIQDLATTQITSDISSSTTSHEPQGEVIDAASKGADSSDGEPTNTKVPALVDEVNQIVEDLLEQPASTNRELHNTDPQDSTLHPATEDSSTELPAHIHPQDTLGDYEDIQLAKESPTAHVASFEGFADEDMDNPMSDSHILLESTANVNDLEVPNSNKSFHYDTRKTEKVVESDPIENRGSFDLMPNNSLHANSQSDFTPAESSIAFATASEADDTFSFNATSSFENDDTDILRQFLSRVKADKAAKAAAPPPAPAPQKRKSLPHSPLRIPLGDITNAEASSPVQAPKDEFDISVSIISSPTRKSREATPPPTDERDGEPQSIRRSGRARPPAAKIPLPAPSSIPVRRLGRQDCDTAVTLKQSVEKELAALTRVNTRKNKAGAVLPEVLLARKANSKENPAKRQKELKEMFEEKLRRENKRGGKMKKSVVWAEEIAQYQTLEKKERRTMESRRVDKSGERIADDGEAEEKDKAKAGEASEKKVRVKISSGSGSGSGSKQRMSKIAVGIPVANSTPSRKKRVGKA